MNVFILIYLIANRGLVTDFSEPPSMFSLALNSPPNSLMAGSCGGGPEGKQFSVKWGVEMEGEHLYVTDKEDGAYGSHGRSAISESLHSFKDLVRKRGTAGSEAGGKWDRLHDNSNIEMGNTSYLGVESLDRQLERQQTASTIPQSTTSSRPGLNLSRTFSRLAKRSSAL
jgi:hypothetical protein